MCSVAFNSRIARRPRRVTVTCRRAAKFPGQGAKGSYSRAVFANFDRFRSGELAQATFEIGGEFHVVIINELDIYS
jgi:hypothetical protein